MTLDRAALREPLTKEQILGRCVVQTKFGMEGNCFSACMASILGLSIAEVPEFAEGHGGWFIHWQRWLKQYGLHMEISQAPMPGLSIADVPSPTMENQRHSVVAYHGEIIWNPLPPHTQTWKAEDVCEWIYFTIHDPGRAVKTVQLLDALEAVEASRQGDHDLAGEAHHLRLKAEAERDDLKAKLEQVEAGWQDTLKEQKLVRGSLQAKLAASEQRLLGMANEVRRIRAQGESSSDFGKGCKAACEDLLAYLGADAAQEVS